MKRLKRLPSSISRFIKTTFWKAVRSSGFWFTTIAIVIVILGTFISYVNWEFLRDGTDTPESYGDTIRNIGILIGGLVALVFAIWRSVVAQKQADAAQQSLLNERYQRGSEMLGSGERAVRLGGIYALRNLAEEHPEQYHMQVMRLLCAFVRNPTEQEVVQTEVQQTTENPLLREDVQVAIDAICACHEINTKKSSITQFWLNFRGADLRGAHFRGVDLSVKPSLTGGTFAEFINSHQRGADFEGARLHSANMEFATLSGANFSNAKLVDAHLDGTNLSEARFSNAKLCNAWLYRADISRSDLMNADLSGAELGGTNLSGAKFVDLDSEILPRPVQGLTQSQLDEAIADLDNPPVLDGVLDAETGEQLVWRSDVPRDDQQ